MAGQTRAIFDAIASLLASQGATPADLIKTTTFVVGRENLAAFDAARSALYTSWFPHGDFTANTLVLVAGLVSESMFVEVEGSFVCPSTDQPPNPAA